MTLSKMGAVLAYVDHFRSQYTQLFPHRPPLLLTAKDESQTERFLTLMVRPTELQYIEMYDLAYTANFLSMHITYTPLDAPAAHPPLVKSPQHTMVTQCGTSFDSALLLASLLIGVGYDAYAVVGYATRRVTECDLSGLPCTVDTSTELDVVKLAPPPPAPKTRYSVKRRHDLVSRFDNRPDQPTEEEKAAAEAAAAAAAAGPKIPVKAVEDDELYGKRYHSWVIVLAGKRDMQKTVFVETTTGQIFGLHDPAVSEYLDIEALYNQDNYWVNMQHTPLGVAEMRFDLSNMKDWEFVIDPEDGLDIRTAEAIPPAIELPRPQFDAIYPESYKTSMYADAQVERFAPFYHPEGLVLRVMYNDDRGTVNVYANRKDKLRKRRHFRENNANIKEEMFMPGKRGDNQYEALKKILDVKRDDGSQRLEYSFYAEARTDGLDMRIEDGDLVLEMFKGRSDALLKRKTRYRGGQIVRMSERYEPTHEIAKRVFDRDVHLVRLVYNYVKDCITQSTYSFTQSAKDKLDVDISQRSPYAAPMDDKQLMDMYQSLLIYEKHAEAAVREGEKDIAEVVVQRQRDEASVLLETTVYDTLRNKPSQEELTRIRLQQEEEARKRAARDYLTPFLPRAEGVFTREEAIATKEACLKALKERLIDRATIIQSRLDEEKANHARRKQAFVRNEGHMDKAEEEEILAYCEEAMFRIHILEQRLARHEELAVQKYTELEAKLRQDPRLAAFLG